MLYTYRYRSATKERRKDRVKKLFSFLLALLLLCLAVSAAAPDACAAEEGGYVYITKSPSGETVSEGDDALFISRAENYTGIVWLIISPDGETVYEKTYSREAALSQDEAAILTLMLNAVRHPESAVSLEETLEDAYTALLMRESIEKGAEVRSRKMPWATEH